MMEILLSTLKWSAAAGTAALLLTLCKPLLDRRYSAKWRYGAWLVLALLLLLAPVRWEDRLPRRAEPPVVIDVPQAAVDFRDGLTVRPAQAPAVPMEPGRPAPRESLPLETVLATLWLAGAGLFLFRHLAGTWRFARRARRWSRPAGEDAARLYESARLEMGLGKAPPLAVSAQVDSPMVLGLFRPRLLLPEGDFALRQLAFIFRHELTHYKRRDLWYKLVLLSANALHWFNPLIYLLRREAERDLELTCDDAVMAGADLETRRAYSETLLSSIRPQKRKSLLSTHFYGGKEAMKERFRNILGKRGRKRGLAVLAAALLATVGAACAFGLRPSGDLSAAELAEWQARIDDPAFQPWISRMYTDPALLPPEELRTEAAPVRAAVTGGSRRDGGLLSLELEGAFPNGLTQGTLILRDEVPIYFSTPFYNVVEGESRKLMNTRAALHIAESAENGFITGTLDFPEKYITSLTCRESQTFDGVTYYVWTLEYRLRPNDMGNVMLAGGMNVENGWLTEQDSMGSPLLIFSIDERGIFALEEQTWTTSHGARPEGGWTWEEYLYCALHLGLGGLERGIPGGWPALDDSLLESLQNGHDTWATEWEDVAHTYLHRAYGIEDYQSAEVLRTFRADGAPSAHDQSLLLRVNLGSGRGTVDLLLAHVSGSLDGSPIWFWQLCGQRWENPPPDPAPLLTPEPPETPEAAMPAPAPSAPDVEQIPAPLPETPPETVPAVRTPTGTIGDFDGDGVRDEWVWINGSPHRVLVDPGTGDVTFDPPAPEVWNDVYAGVQDPETGDVLFAPGTPETGGESGGAAVEPDPAVRTPTRTIGDFDGDGVADPDVWINGQHHRVTVDPATGDVAFDPPAPEVWDTVSTTAPS